ncbi:MAG TPA: sugar transferase, partial [Candidatus Angelobacter sp.]|nr:sugar transferase [Candidatus Angelobacter sp.]
MTLLQDLAVVCVSFVAAYFLRTLLVHFEFFSRHLPGIYPFMHYLSLMAAFLGAWALVGYVSKFYRDLEMSNPVQVGLNLLNQLAVVLVLMYALLYLSRREDISRTYVLLIGAVSFVLLVAARYVSYNSIAAIRKRLGRYHYFLIVGCGTRAHEMASLIEESRGMGLRLLAFADPTSEGSKLTDHFGDYPVIPVSSVPSFLEEHVVDEVVFAVNMQELARLESLMSHCANVGIKTRVQLEFLPAPYSRIYLENFRDVPLLSLSSAPESELLLLLKRIGDVVVAAVSMVVLAPVLIIVAAAIRITSPGNVLFRQTRCGLGGRKFTLYKFRSMVNNAEQLRAELHQFNESDGPVFKISDDPRITSVGRVLRRFSLDELPQLWNILRGDMSFVGPRPAIPNEVEKYEPWQRRRLRMRPGLTCIWVLEGRSDVTFHRWVQLDLAYIDSWSLWLD